jgi:uncharacterized protein YraI
MKPSILLSAIALSILPLMGCTINVPAGSKASTSDTSKQNAEGMPAANAQPVANQETKQFSSEQQPAAAAQPVANRPQPIESVPPDAGSAGGEGDYVVRTRDGNGVNVRAGASTQSAVIASLRDGATVIMHGSDRSGAWSEVSAANRVRGWVATEYLQGKGSGVISQAPRAYSDTDRSPMRVRTMDGDPVNLRSEPRLDGQVITAVPNGTVVYYEDTVGQWTQVSTQNGTKGFVASNYLVND